MSQLDPVAFAKTYPFPSPGHSFLFRNGRTEPLTGHQFDRSARTAVLAAGSNRSPEQLARKYAAFEGEAEIPAEMGLLHGYDTVYAGHFAGYGSVPATFFPSPGTAVSTFLLWLDDGQLSRMHETERTHYACVRLDGLRFETAGGGADPASAWAYLALTGCIAERGEPIALAEVPAHGRRFAARNQVEMLDFARRIAAPDQPLDEFILETVRRTDVRERRTSALADHTTPIPGLDGSAGVDGSSRLL